MKYLDFIKVSLQNSPIDCVSMLDIDNHQLITTWLDLSLTGLDLSLTVTVEIHISTGWLLLHYGIHQSQHYRYGPLSYYCWRWDSVEKRSPANEAQPGSILYSWHTGVKHKHSAARPSRSVSLQICRFRFIKKTSSRSCHWLTVIHQARYQPVKN